MNAMPLETALVLASTTGVGYLMLTAGLEKKALVWRRRRRVCASCGKHLPGHKICNCARG
jgi:hypothetical protein